jgi:hypothetical protein
MKKIACKLLLLIAFIINNNIANAQGCSDAGFCSISNFKPTDSTDNILEKNQFMVGFSVGKGINTVDTYNPYFQYKKSINNRFSFDIKLTSAFVSSRAYSTSNLSDIYINTLYKINKNLGISAGAKFPLSPANDAKNGALPMDYQVSLGTYDIILGLQYEYKKIQFAAGFQMPVKQNENQFLNTDYPSTSYLYNWQSTNKFKRSSDVLLRVSYPVYTNKKFKITPSVLPIFHLANDTYVDAANVEQSIVGSSGLTLNGNLFLDYKLNSKSAFQFSIGAPFVVRKSKPEGLGRSLVLALEYKINF